MLDQRHENPYKMHRNDQKTPKFDIFDQKKCQNRKTLQARSIPRCITNIAVKEYHIHSKIGCADFVNELLNSTLDMIP